MKKILIIGAGGFVGKNLIEAACADPSIGRVHIIVRKRDNELSRIIATHEKNLRIHELDVVIDQDRLQELMATEVFDGIINLSTNTQSLKDNGTDKCVEKEMSMLKAILNSVAQGSTAQSTYIDFSSCAIYEGSEKIISENSNLKPNRAYGGYAVAKYERHLYLIEFLKRKHIRSFLFVPFFLYGAYENPKRLFPLIVHRLLKEEYLPLTKCEQFRDYLHVHDLCTAIILALSSKTTAIAEVLNIGSGNGTKIKDFAIAIAHAMHKPETLLGFGELPERKEEIPRIVANIAKAQIMLGWSPKIDLVDGIQKSLPCYDKINHHE
ncbi:MAG: NAD(P)-dependent oxidoreductase [Candidatus Taylorbacteria bacterium]|nr:NAD(P)-dependent oxidoreductase [Candidatus Taylorbacteria bacterium]